MWKYNSVSKLLTVALASNTWLSSPPTVSFDLNFEESCQNSFQCLFVLLAFRRHFSLLTLPGGRDTLCVPMPSHFLSPSPSHQDRWSCFHKELCTISIYSATGIPQTQSSWEGLCFCPSFSTSFLPLLGRVEHLLGDSVISSVKKMGWKKMREWHCYFRKH